MNGKNQKFGGGGGGGGLVSESLTFLYSGLNEMADPDCNVFKMDSTLTSVPVSRDCCSASCVATFSSSVALVFFVSGILMSASVTGTLLASCQALENL
jgi:hypothetical protein